MLDEADHMAEMGFLPAITELLDMIPVGGQRLLFSATLDRGVDGVVAQVPDRPGHPRDRVRRRRRSRRWTTTCCTSSPTTRPSSPPRSPTARAARVIFVRTKLGADRVAGQLRQAGVAAAALHGGLAQGARNAVLNAFKEGTLPVLVATDVAARGIHVDDIGLVLQIDPPQDHKDYLHRAGRTARAGGRGTVVTLALPHQRRAVERLTRAAGVEVRGDPDPARRRGARPGDRRPPPRGRAGHRRGRTPDHRGPPGARRPADPQWRASSRGSGSTRAARVVTAARVVPRVDPVEKAARVVPRVDPVEKAARVVPRVDPVEKAARVAKAATPAPSRRATAASGSAASPPAPADPPALGRRLRVWRSIPGLDPRI